MRGLALKPFRINPVEQPRVCLDFDTFEEWDTKAEPYSQMQFGYLSRHQRSCFDMCGQTVFIETIVPASIFDDIIMRHVLADFNITEYSSTMKLAKKHGGVWEGGYYADHGYGWPVFTREKGARYAWNFIHEWLDTPEKSG